MPIELIATYLFGEDRKAKISLQSKAVRMCSDNVIECKKVARYLFVRSGDFAKLIAEFVVMSEYMKPFIPENVTVTVRQRRIKYI